MFRVRILEALETVGEEEMLRKLEESIMSGRIASNTTMVRNPQIGTHHHGTCTAFTPLLSRDNVGGLLSKRSLQQSVGVSQDINPITTIERKKPQLLEFETTASYLHKNSSDYANSNYQSKFFIHIQVRHSDLLIFTQIILQISDIHKFVYRYYIFIIDIIVQY